MPEVLQHDALEKTLAEIIKQWQRFFPHEAVAHDVEVRTLRETMRKASGMSRFGNSMAQTAIPVRLHKKCLQVFGPAFWNDRKNCQTFRKVFRKAKVTA